MYSAERVPAAWEEGGEVGMLLNSAGFSIELSGQAEQVRKPG